jgi:hypothetical protein
MARSLHSYKAQLQREGGNATITAIVAPELFLLLLVSSWLLCSARTYPFPDLSVLGVQLAVLALCFTVPTARSGRNLANTMHW